MNNINKGNKVVTIVGLFGEILEIKDNIIDLKVADQVVLKMARSSVASNLSQGKLAKEELAEKKTVEEQPTDIV